MSSLRILLLVSSTLTFFWYAVKDMRFHLVGRSVSRAENALHGALGLSQLALFIGAFAGAGAWVAGGALATAALGAGDEYVFHRGLPAVEADFHAKAHLALFRSPSRYARRPSLSLVTQCTNCWQCSWSRRGPGLWYVGSPSLRPKEP